MATISRLKAAEISNGNVIDADDIEAELDQLVSELNSKETRLDDLESNAISVSGLKTFNDGIATNTIAERTAGSGVTIDSVLLKDGFMGAGSLSGAGVNAQTGTTYTVLTGDRNKLVTFSNASAIAVTLPQAGSAGFANNFVFSAVNRGAGLVTITPTTSTIDGASTLTLATDQGVMIFSDGTNYFTNRGRGKTDGWELITTNTFSGQSLVAFNGILDATIYSQVQFDIDIVPDVDQLRFGCQLGNGSSYETGASDYRNSLTVDGVGQNFASTYISLMYDSGTAEIGNASYEGYTSIVDVKNWSDSAKATKVLYNTAYDLEDGGLYMTTGVGRRSAAAAHTDIRFYGDDNFSGTIYAWGKRYA